MRTCDILSTALRTSTSAPRHPCPATPLRSLLETTPPAVVAIRTESTDMLEQEAQAIGAASGAATLYLRDRLTVTHPALPEKCRSTRHGRPRSLLWGLRGCMRKPGLEHAPSKDFGCGWSYFSIIFFLNGLLDLWLPLGRTFVTCFHLPCFPFFHYFILFFPCFFNTELDSQPRLFLLTPPFHLPSVALLNSFLSLLASLIQLQQLFFSRQYSGLLYLSISSLHSYTYPHHNIALSSSIAIMFLLLSQFNVILVILLC